jgi:agmatinase
LEFFFTDAVLTDDLQGEADLENDQTVGFQLISTDDIDDLGIPEIIKRIRTRVGSTPVYLR